MRPESSLFSRSAVLLHALLWQAWIKTSSCCYLTFWTTTWWGRSAWMTSASRCASWATRSPPAQPTAPTHPRAAACAQEAPGAWYFLQARPERGHLYSLDTSTVWYSTYSFKAGNQRLWPVSKPFCPKTGASWEGFRPPALGDCRSAAGCRWWCDCVMSFKPQSFSLTSRKKNLRYSKTNIPGNEVKLEKLQSRQRLWKCPCI